MDEFAEDQHPPRLPDVVEEYLAGERCWHRLLRGSGLVSQDEAAADLERWMERWLLPGRSTDVALRIRLYRGQGARRLLHEVSEQTEPSMESGARSRSVAGLRRR